MSKLINHPGRQVRLVEDHFEENGRTYPGLTRVLGRLFWPHYRKPLKVRSGGGSTKKSGQRIHAQVGHLLLCKERGTCNCKEKPRPFRQPKRISRCTQAILDGLREKRYKILGSEIALCSQEKNLATAMDLVCEAPGLPRSQEPPPELVVSLKTGHATSSTLNTSHSPRDPFLRPPFEKLLNTPQNHAQVQVLYEHLIAERSYGIRLQGGGHILYANSKGEHHWEPMDPGFYDEKFRDRAWEALKKTIIH